MNSIDYFINLFERMNDDADGMNLMFWLSSANIPCDFDKILIKRLESGWTSFGQSDTIWSEESFFKAHGFNPVHIIFSIRFYDINNQNKKYSIYKKVLGSNVWRIRTIVNRQLVSELDVDTERLREFILEHAIK